MIFRKSAAFILVLWGVFFLTSDGYAQSPASRKVMPKKVEIDRDYDGKPDYVEHYNEAGEVINTESDTNGDGVIDEWAYFKNENITKLEKDTNGDGKADTWISY